MKYSQVYIVNGTGPGRTASNCYVTAFRIHAGDVMRNARNISILSASAATSSEVIIIIILIIIIIIIIISTTMFMVLSSWQSHCESSPGSFDECRMAPRGRRPKTKPDDLGCESACTGCQKLHPPSPFISTQPES